MSAATAQHKASRRGAPLRKTSKASSSSAANTRRYGLEDEAEEASSDEEMDEEILNDFNKIIRLLVTLLCFIDKHFAHQVLWGVCSGRGVGWVCRVEKNLLGHYLESCICHKRVLRF